MLWLLLGTIVIIGITGCLLHSRKKHQFWKTRGIGGPKTTPFLGHFLTLLDKKKHRWVVFDELYKKWKGSQYFGIYEFSVPRLILCDPEMVKAVLVKDFDHFVDRRQFEFNAIDNAKDDVMEKTIVFASGDKWRSIRNLVTPAFTSGKLKSMFPEIEKEADNMVEHCREKTNDGTSFDICDAAERFGVNVIASCAFGVEGRCFAEEAPMFLKLVKKVVDFKLTLTIIIKAIVYQVSRTLFKLLGLSFVSDGILDLSKIVKHTLLERQKNNVRNEDFLDNMMDAVRSNKKIGSSEEDLDESIVVSQAILFIIAGYDTIRNNMSLAAYNLAKYPEVQKRAREDNTKAVQENGFTYDAIMNLKYLDAFLSESMRVLPTAYFLERQCTKEYRLPQTDIVIPKNTLVGIPTFSFHKDPDFWIEPEEFIPDRFMPENQNVINQYAYFPFGLGPRNCLGVRFALLQLKIALAKLLLNFELTINDEFELTFLPNQTAMKPENGIPLYFKYVATKMKH